MEKIGIKVDTKATISDFFMMEISESKRLMNDYETPLNDKNYAGYISDEIHEKIDQVNDTTGDINISNEFQASFWFSFLMLFKRDWTIFWRDRMKFGVCLMNTVMRFLLVGILFMDVIPDRSIISLFPVEAFIGIQGLAFNCVASTVMPSINVVVLARILCVIKFPTKDSCSISKMTQENIELYHTSYQRFSSCTSGLLQAR